MNGSLTRFARLCGMYGINIDETKMISYITITKFPEHTLFYNKLRIFGIFYMLHLPVNNLIGRSIGEMFRMKYMIISNQVIIKIKIIIINK